MIQWHDTATRSSPRRRCALPSTRAWSAATLLPHGMRLSYSLRVVLAGLLCLGVLLFARNAAAYPWMIRHDYTGCIQCHVDPDGAGLLTEYGRAQGETLLRTRYSSTASDEEPGRVKDFLWGLFKTPDWLLLGGSFRPAVLAIKTPGEPADTTALIMEADLRAGIKSGGWRASASVGAISTSGSLASVAGPIVSREHWVGYSWDDDELMLRAGRINLPFGIRQNRASALGSGDDPDEHRRQSRPRRSVRLHWQALPGLNHGHPRQLPESRPMPFESEGTSGFWRSIRCPAWPSVCRVLSRTRTKTSTLKWPTGDKPTEATSAPRRSRLWY